MLIKIILLFSLIFLWILQRTFRTRIFKMLCWWYLIICLHFRNWGIIKFLVLLIYQILLNIIICIWTTLMSNQFLILLKISCLLFCIYWFILIFFIIFILFITILITKLIILFLWSKCLFIMIHYCLNLWFHILQIWG